MDSEQLVLPGEWDAPYVCMWCAEEFWVEAERDVHEDACEHD